MTEPVTTSSEPSPQLPDVSTQPTQPTQPTQQLPWQPFSVSPAPAKPLLDREEYIEQAYFFRVYRERLDDNVPAQVVLAAVHEEILATTKLPYAIEFLRGEVMLNGRMSEGMARLSHYFTPFQAFIVRSSEDDRGKFDQRTALAVLQHEAEYRSQAISAAGLFIFQFECISRNRLGYDTGMQAMASDPFYDDDWSAWILRARLQLGAIEFSDLVYLASEQFVEDRRRETRSPDFQPRYRVLFGRQEGRIAKANRGRDPLYMFGALQRQLGYPRVPRARGLTGAEKEIPEMKARLLQLEKRLTVLEADSRNDLDLSQFYSKSEALPAPLDDEPPSSSFSETGDDVS